MLRGTATLLLAILSGAVFAPAQQKSPDDARTAAAVAPRVLLIGIDGADPRIIDRLIAAKKLPTFQRLKREGAFGPLRSQEPLLSPVVWTSIATGRLAQDHGVLDFVEIGADGKPIPITSLRRKVAALWNVAGQFGRSSGFVGWYGSYPAEKVAGFEVSDRLGFHQVRSASAVSGATFPAELAGEIKSRFGAPVPDVAATRRRFLSDPASRMSSDGAARLEQLAKIYATSEFYRKLLPFLQSRHRVDLLAVYFEGIDACGHLFMEDAAPRRPDVSPDDFRAFSGAVDRYYEYQDEVLADLLRLEGPSTVTLVVSDHGFKEGDARPRTSGRADTGLAPLWHRIDGVIFVHGKSVRSGARVERAGILDVAPTVLRLLDAPLSRELPGHPVADAFAPGALGIAPPSVAAYAVPKREKNQPIASDPEAVEKLMALGYLAGGGKAMAHDAEGRTASSYVNEGQARTHTGDWQGALRAFGRASELDPRAVNALAPAAAIYIQHRQYDQASVLLGRAAKVAPGNLWVLIQRAFLNFRTGRLAEAIKDFEAAKKLDDRLPGVHLLGARLENARGESARALQELEEAESLADANEMRAEIFTLRAEIQIALRRYPDAEESLQRAAALVPDSQLAASRGSLAFARGDFAGAQRWFREGAAADPESSELERLAGEAAGGANAPSEAEQAFRRAIAKARTPEETELAWGDLSLLFQKAGRERETIATLRDSVQRAPDSHVLWGMLGAALGRTGDLPGAIAAYEKSISLKPTALACKTLGALYFEVRHDGARAVALWEQSLALDPEQPDVKNFLRRYRKPTGRLTPNFPRR
ncbi:MAG: alkaline phosphatase family protein [Acidobacteriota bacterium]